MKIDTIQNLEQDERLPVLFNMALAYLQRMHITLMNINEARENNDTYMCKEFLDTLFSELYPEMGNNDSAIKLGISLNDFIKLKEQCDEEYYKMLRRTKCDPNTFINSRLDMLNDIMELKLRKLMNERGLLQPKSQDPGTAIMQ